MAISSIVATVGILFSLAIVAMFVTLFVLVVRALLKYIRARPVREEQSAVKRSLGEALKAHRTRCKMTQEFVAESVGGQPAGRVQVGTGSLRPKHLQSVLPGQAVRRVRGGTAERGGVRSNA